MRKKSNRKMIMERLRRVVKRAVFYVRCSSTMQSDGYSLEYQEQQAMRYIEKKGYTFVRMYVDEAKTAKKTAGRDSLNQMLEDAANDEFDVIIVFSFSRTFRNTKDALNTHYDLMEKYAIGIESIIEPVDMSSPHGKFSATNLFAMHELSSDMTAAHVRAGMYYAVQQGYHLQGAAPYGYDSYGTGEFSSKGKERKKLKINEKEAAIVREMFELHNAGLSFSDIARIFHGRGEKFYNDKIFTHEQVGYIIKNKRYCGYLEFNFKGYDKLVVKHDVPIVSEEVWQKSQDIYKNRVSNEMRNRVPRSKKIYAASGKIVCDSCGALYHGSGNDDTSYYRCRNRAKGRDCRNINVRKEKLESALMKAIFDNILNDKSIDYISDVIYKQVSRIPKRKNDTAKLKAKKKALTDELKNLVRQNLSNSISASVLEELSADLNQELQEVETALTESEREQNIDYSKEMIANYIKSLKNIDVENADLYKKMLIDAFVESATVTEDTLVIILRVLPFRHYSYKQGMESPNPSLYELAVIVDI